MKAARTFVIAFCLLVTMALFFGCSDGSGVPKDNPFANSLSPTLSKLIVSGNTISKKTGGILSLSCEWTSGVPVTTATAYLAIVKDMGVTTQGPTGVLGSGSTSASSTTTTTPNIVVTQNKIPGFSLTFAPYPLHAPNTQISTGTTTGTATNTSTSTSTSTSTVTATSTSTTTSTNTQTNTGTATGTSTNTATSTSTTTSTSTSTITQTNTGTATSTSTQTTTGTATGTSTATQTSTGTATGTSTTTSTATATTQLIPNPLAIPTGFSTTQLSGQWQVQVPFPASALTNTSVGKLQVLLWMEITGRKTNTLAFEIEITL